MTTIAYILLDAIPTVAIFLIQWIFLSIFFCTYMLCHNDQHDRFCKLCYSVATHFLACIKTQKTEGITLSYVDAAGDATGMFASSVFIMDVSSWLILKFTKENFLCTCSSKCKCYTMIVFYVVAIPSPLVIILTIVHCICLYLVM